MSGQRGDRGRSAVQPAFDLSDVPATAWATGIAEYIWPASPKSPGHAWGVRARITSTDRHQRKCS